MRMRHPTILALALSSSLVSSDAAARDQGITVLAETCQFINGEGGAPHVIRPNAGGVTGPDTRSWRLRCPVDFFDSLAHPATVTGLRAAATPTCEYGTEVTAQLRRREQLRSSYETVARCRIRFDGDPNCIVLGVDHSVDDQYWGYVVDFDVPYSEGDCWTWRSASIYYSHLDLD